MSHKIFHPRQWREIDWYAALSNHLTFRNNWDLVKNIVQSPLKIILFLVVIASELDLRFGIKIHNNHLFWVILIGLPIWTLIDHFGGQWRVVLTLQSYIAKASRHHNDPETEQHLENTRDIHSWLREDLLK